MTESEISNIIQAKRYFQNGLYWDEFESPIKNYVKTAVNALEKQIPKKPIHFYKEYPKHDWLKNKEGRVDIGAWDGNYDGGYHGGVYCQRCQKCICVCCNPNYDDEKCVVDEQICPNPDCNALVVSGEVCNKCGQALDWGEQASKERNDNGKT